MFKLLDLDCSCYREPVTGSLLSTKLEIPQHTLGAAAYGLIMSTYSAGSLLGIGLAGLLPNPTKGN